MPKDRKLKREIDGIKVFKHNFNKEDIIKPFRCSNGKEFYTGLHFWTNEGYLIKIIEYYNEFNVLIEFLYNGYRQYNTIHAIKEGAVKNPYHINIYGGYVGVGEYSRSMHKKAYSTWRSMLCRNTLEGQLSNRKNASYSNCAVCNEWYNFQNFASWFIKYIDNLNPWLYDDYQLDKDILQWNQSYKLYSPDTCCIVPSKINACLDGIYRLGKELPTGVKLTQYGKYKVVMSIENEQKYYGVYDTPEEAFEVYRQTKKGYITKLADEYYVQAAIHRALYNIEILPYI